MKTLKVTFEDREYALMIKEKEKFKLSWHDFLFCRINKIRMKGEMPYRKKDLKVSII